jgi:predicted nucleotidyltransferase
VPELLELARRIAGTFPALVEEVVVTGSVSRGVADEVSDIEMLVVTREELDLDACFALARDAGLTDLDTWGVQNVPTKRVSGYREGVPIELIWWARAYAEDRIDAILAGEEGGSAEAIASGVAVRTEGALAQWQARLANYPDDVALARIDEAALPWGGFAPAGLLTIVREGDRLALLEWMVDGAQRVLKLLYALNRQWQPTTKRLARRVEALAVKPERLAERITEALTEPEPRAALLEMTRLQLDAVNLAPDTPNVVRARDWLARGVEILDSR